LGHTEIPSLRTDLQTTAIAVIYFESTCNSTSLLFRSEQSLVPVVLFLQPVISRCKKQWVDMIFLFSALHVTQII
jgi:hypothetical protein